jgi:hypothetical protein
MERYVGHEVNVSFGRQKYPRTSRHPFYTVHNKLPIKPLTSSQRGQQRRDEGRVLRSYMYMGADATRRSRSAHSIGPTCPSITWWLGRVAPGLVTVKRPRLV